MKAEDHVYAVILAGGSGTRFWPKSRQRTPKQLCSIGTSDISMIEKTLARLDGFIPAERRIIVTHAMQLGKTRDLVGKQCRHFLAEPDARNTAAALSLAAMEIAHLSPGKDPVMVSLHADHIITNEDEFRKDLHRAVGVAEQGYLTLMGVKPGYAETGYGYIEVGAPLTDAAEFAGHSVTSFREKPDLTTAKHYLTQGNFLWNSGYFIWRVSTILNELREHLPETYGNLWQLCERGTVSFNDVSSERLTEVYRSLTKIAIDNAVLEISNNVAVIQTDFGWYDIGSWDAMTKCFKTDDAGNYIEGDSFVLDCSGSTIETDGPFVAVIGLDDVVVVAARGAILVCAKDRAQDVKKVVDHLAQQGRSDLL